MAGNRGKLLVRWGVGLLLAPFASAGLYLWAAVVGGLLPVNSNWTQPDRGVTIYVESSAIHTGLVLPLAAEGIDWRGVARPEHLRNPAFGTRPYLAFGWGDREFYMHTPSLAQMNPGRALAALIGTGQTVLHVAHVEAPVPGPGIRALRLRPDEYRRLTAFVGATFAADAAWLGPGYSANDAFYAARGGYSAFNTCNAWTGRALAAAGVRIGAWTPLPPGVMLWLP